MSASDLPILESTATRSRCRLSVIMTVKNDPDGVRLTLDSLFKQRRVPDEIVVVDGGSTDATYSMLTEFARSHPKLRVLQAVGANIARGRNLATQTATYDIMVSTDAGCRARADWLEKIIAPFERDPSTEFVAGFYRIAPRSLFEKVVGLCTMRGQLEPIDPHRFNPSARSVAYTKSLWQRVGGWPEWLNFSEDTWFDHRVRESGAKWQHAQDAIVSWRPRSSWRSLAKQFYNYGTGRGFTGIDKASFHYNLRNLLIVITLLALTPLYPIAAIPLSMAVLYFYVWTFHAKCLAVTQRCRMKRTYPLALAVTWTVLFSNVAGFLKGRMTHVMRGPRINPEPAIPPTPSCEVTTPVSQPITVVAMIEPTRTEPCLTTAHPRLEPVSAQ